MSGGKWNTDKLIEQVIRNDFDNAPEPPVSMEDMWVRISKEMKEPTERENFKLLRRGKMVIAASVIVIIFLSTTFFQVKNNAAFGWVSSFYTKIEGSITQLINQTGGSGSAENSPPSSDTEILDVEIKQEKMSIIKARNVAKFQIVQPQFIPIDYELVDVTVLFFGEEESEHIELNYLNGEDRFVIREKYFEGLVGSTLALDNEDTIIKEISINGHDGTFLRFKDGFNQLVWYKLNIQFMIEGEIPEEVIIKIAESM